MNQKNTLRKVVLELGMAELDTSKEMTQEDKEAEKKRRTTILQQKHTTSAMDLGLKVMVEDMIMVSFFDSLPDS